MKYHFLNGKTAETKEFKNDEEAIAAAKADKSVLRVQCDKTLKHIYEATASLAKAAALLIACLLISLAASAATTVGITGTQGLYGYAVSSSSSTSTNGVSATNGLYGAFISAATTETNLIQLTPGSLPDGDVVIQFTGQGSSSSVTNVQFVISSSLLPITITNNPTLGLNQTANPRGVFATITLALSGTTPATTNVVFSKFSTPPVANGLSLYLESINNNNGGSGTGTLTNYSVVVVQ